MESSYNPFVAGMEAANFIQRLNLVRLKLTMKNFRKRSGLPPDNQM